MRLSLHANARVVDARLNAGARVDLVFSDVVMPGKLSGFDLARIIAEKWPRIRVLLTSGFPEAAVGHNGHTPGMSILSKPYRKDELARKIRRTLES